jgi:endoglucanase
MIRTLKLALMIAGLFALQLASHHCFAQPSNSLSMTEANQRLGRGMNLGNFLEVPAGENWAIPIDVSHLQIIKKAGFDSVRLPVKWSEHAAASSPYSIDESFAKRVDAIIDGAEKVGLNVVLNIHHYYDLDEAPKKHTDRFVAIWKQLANRYKQRGDFLYFELNNEPHENLNDHWNDVLKLGLSAVRETNPTRPVIIGPPFWNGIWALPKLTLPEDDHLIVTVHMYNPFEFTHQGATWSGPEVESIRNRSFGSAEEIAKVREELKQAADWGKANNVPIYVGEFGAYSLAPQASRVKWTQTVVQACEDMDLSWSYWEFGAGFGAYNMETKQWRDDLLNALIAK